MPVPHCGSGTPNTLYPMFVQPWMFPNAYMQCPTYSFPGVPHTNTATSSEQPAQPSQSTVPHASTTTSSNDQTAPPIQSTSSVKAAKSEDNRGDSNQSRFSLSQEELDEFLSQDIAMYDTTLI